MSRRIKRRKAQQFRERRRRLNAARAELAELFEAALQPLVGQRWDAGLESRAIAAISDVIAERYPPAYAIDVIGPGHVRLTIW